MTVEVEGSPVYLHRNNRKAMLKRIRTYETWVTFASERSCICSSVAPINRKPHVISRNGVRFWKMLVSGSTI